MALLKDLIVTGSSRLIGDTFTNKIQITTLNAPTSAGGTTYGPGTNGYVLKTNGTSIYWGSDNATDNTKVAKAGDTMSGILYINNTTDAAATNDTGALIIGNKAGENIAIDSNEVMARNNKTASTLYLNNDGGLVSVGSGGLTTTGKLESTWLRVVNNSSNNSDDAMVYLENKSTGDWALKIVKDTNAYGLNILGSGNYLLLVGTATPTLRVDTGNITINGASINMSKAGEVGVEVDNTQSTNPNKVAFIVGSSGNGGIYSRKHSKWIVYSDASGNVVLNGNANTASKLATARTITLSGSVTGSATFDGSANITISTTTNHNHDSVYKKILTAVSSPSASNSEISFIDTISLNTLGVITATKKTVQDASFSQSGILSTSKQSIAGLKTIRYSTRIYPIVGASAERSQWYKITFPYYNAETTSSAKWFMNSFDLHFGGGYSGNSNGIIHIAFYWTRAKENGAWSATLVSALANGIYANKIILYYRIAEPGILYVNNTSNQYNGLWLDNLFVDDTSPSLDWSTTKIETCAAITASTTPALTDYTIVPLANWYTENGTSLKTNVNIEGQYIKGTWLYTSAATALTTPTKIATIHTDNYIYYSTPANVVKAGVGTSSIGGTSTPIYWNGSSFVAGTSYANATIGTAGYATTASQATHAATANSATTASEATHAATANSATTASLATHAATANTAATAGFATTASLATHAATANSATTATEATHAATANTATTASYATTAGSANAVAWGNVSGKPSTFAPSAHDHSLIVTAGDNRNVSTTPNNYSNKIIFQGLKAKASINNPSTDTYSYLVGLRGWSDSSGGDSHEIAFNNTGLYWRTGATTAWNAWNRIVTNSGSWSITAATASEATHAATANSANLATRTTGANISTTTNAIAKYSSGTGTFANSGVTIDSSNNMIIPGTSLKVTNTSGAKYILMGNQDSSGANCPVIMQAANGTFYLGNGTDWSSSTGGTLSTALFMTKDRKIGIGTTSPSAKLHVNGDTYAADRVTMAKGFKNLLTGTGTAGVNNSGTYTPVKWTFNASVTVADGDRFTVKIPNITNGDWGIFMSVNNGTNYYPIALLGKGRLTTHYPVDSYIDVVFEAAGQVESVFPLAGGTARTTVTGGCWRVINYYDSNSDWGYYSRKIYSNIKAGPNKIFPYTLIMLNEDGCWESIVTSSSTGTGKVENSNGFLLGQVWTMYANATYNENAIVGTYNVYTSYSLLIDARYSFNVTTSSGFTANKPIYLVGTLGEFDNSTGGGGTILTKGNNNTKSLLTPLKKFYLLPSTYGSWWTQDPVSTFLNLMGDYTINTYIFIYVGDAYDTYRMTLSETNTAYVIYGNTITSFNTISFYSANSDFSNHAEYANYALNANFSDLAANATNAANANKATTAGFATTASQATHAATANTASTAGYATTASLTTHSATANSATTIFDRTNSTLTYSNYGATGLAATSMTWMTCWNGYELRAISKAETANAVDSAHKWVRLAGDTVTGTINRTNQGSSWIGSRDLTKTIIATDASSSTSSTAFSLASIKFQDKTYALSSERAGNLFGLYGWLNNRTENGYDYAFYIANDTYWHTNTRIYGAVWNDYAEKRNIPEAQNNNWKDEECKANPLAGYCVVENGDDTMSLSTMRLQKGCKIISDTFGFSIGETETAKTPVAVSGRVLAYLYEGREEAKKHIGDFVCSGPNGTISIMTTEEYLKCPLAALGTISAIPDYEEWGTNKIKVNGRIWIYVK